MTPADGGFHGLRRLRRLRPSCNGPRRRLATPREQLHRRGRCRGSCVAIDLNKLIEQIEPRSKMMILLFEPTKFEQFHGLSSPLRLGFQAAGALDQKGSEEAAVATWKQWQWTRFKVIEKVFVFLESAQSKVRLPLCVVGSVWLLVSNWTSSEKKKKLVYTFFRRCQNPCSIL